MRAMRGVFQNVPLKRLISRSIAAAVFVALMLALPAGAQMHGPVPSATSIGGHHLPGPVPSVTSIRPFGFGHQGYSMYPYNSGHYGRGRGYGNYGRSGYGYVYPYYYIPLDDYGYGSDYVGPDLYSGPPPGANDQTLHIVVEQPPIARRYVEVLPDEEPAPARSVRNEQPDAAPLEPTVLIFRDGRRQEVTNYAIMGQTVYVFDKRTQKIALADLDVPATVKVNDDRGIDFKVPAGKQPKKNTAAPAKDAPANNSPKPDNIALLGQ